MNRVRVVLAAPLLLSALMAEPQARQSVPATATDLVLVDAAVVDNTGRPVPSLRPDQFDVTISGRARRVVSVEYVDAARNNAAALPAPDGVGGRLFVIAIDIANHNALESVAICIAAQSLVDTLNPNDRVGVFTYPNGTGLDPTTDRAAIRKALETVVVPPPPPGTSAPPISAAESAKISRAGLQSLLTLIEKLGAIPERKNVVLVSPGLTGSANEVGDLPTQIAQMSVASNATIYAVFVDRSFIDITIQDKDRIAMVSPTRTLEPAQLVTWLERTVTPAGGAVFQVNGINPEPLLQRMSNELSGYYTLGIDGADLDRGNALQDLSVKVRAAGASVRAHRWTLTSRRKDTSAASALVRPIADPPPPPAPPKPSSNPILAAYERGEYATMQERLLREPMLAKWIHDFRGDAHPWPAVPRRRAVFALEVAAAALSTSNGDAREEALKLLVEQSASLTPGAFPESFRCLWYWGALMLFEGSEHPEAATPLTTRALATCPSQPRIVLAHAVLLDQAAPILVGGIRVGAAAAAEEAAHKGVLAAYQAAARFPETENEARVRQAWFLLRLKRYDEALGLLAEMPSSSPPAPTLEESLRRQVDRQVRYVGHLIEGHALRAQGKTGPAAASYRQAMLDWPGAQAARMALMTLQAIAGGAEEAAALAAAIETAPEDTTDPWWWFWQGDRVVYPALIANLRESAR